MSDIGPSVYEYAEMRIHIINVTIEQLQLEKIECKNRLDNPIYRNMLEAERLASKAEPYLKPLS